MKKRKLWPSANPKRSGNAFHSINEVRYAGPG